MTAPLSSALGRAAAVPPTPESKLEEWRREAWQKHGIAVIVPGDMPDAAERAAVERIAERLYGPRAE